jgi:hypothetical protein
VFVTDESDSKGRRNTTRRVRNDACVAVVSTHKRRAASPLSPLPPKGRTERGKPARVRVRFTLVDMPRSAALRATKDIMGLCEMVGNLT